MVKSTRKFIKEIAKSLPNVNYRAKDKRQVTGKDLKLSGHKEIDGETINDNELYTVAFPMEIPVNHERRLKRAFERNGKEGLLHYLSPFIKAGQEDYIHQLVERHA